jgi:hypothetical protein
LTEKLKIVTIRGENGDPIWESNDKSEMLVDKKKTVSFYVGGTISCLIKINEYLYTSIGATYRYSRTELPGMNENEFTLFNDRSEFQIKSTGVRLGVYLVPWKIHSSP